MGGGYIVPEELEDAVRAELAIVVQRVAVNLTPKLSDWIDGSVKPRVAGVYQRRTPAFDFGMSAFSLWDGMQWRTLAGAVDRAAKMTDVSTSQDLPWRGLAEDPSRGTGGAS